MRTMKLTIEFDLDIEGELSDEKATEYFMSNLSINGLISEEIDGTEDWAILINGWELKEAH